MKSAICNKYFVVKTLLIKTDKKRSKRVKVFNALMQNM